MNYLDVKDKVTNFFDPQARARKKELNNAVTKMVAAIKQQHSIYRKEIQEWRMAQYVALAPIDPRRKRIQDLYKEIMGDAFIFGRWQTRMLRVSNKKLEIRTGDDETDEEKTKLIQKGWARKLTKYNLESIPYGYTLPFVKELTEEGFIKSVDMVYRDHIVPETCEVLQSPEDKNGTKFNEGDYLRWMYFVNNTHTLGLLDKAAPLYIFKKHSWQNWDEFEEKFGIPMRIAKVASKDPKVLAEIDKWLKSMGSAPYARFPEGTELEVKESSTTDAYNVFNEKRKACNEELATLFDGHFETAKDSGSRAKAGSIIESTQDMITMDDEAFNLDIWNDTILPWLIELGYPFTLEDKVAYNENVVSTPEERLRIFEGVKKLGYTVKKEQIETELDVEIEAVVPPGPSKVEKPPSNYIRNFNMPHSASCGAHSEDYRIINHDVVNALDPEEEKLLKAIYAGNVNWDYKEFKASHGNLLEGLTKGFAAGVSTDYDADDHRMLAAMRANVHRFGMDKTTAEIFQLNQILKDPEVKTFADFRKRALKVFPNYKVHWLRTEYQQAFVVGQMGQRYQEMISDIEVAPYWQLNAILDDNTTTICRSLDGRVFRKDNAETWRFLPPNHYNCRSDAEDVFESYDGEVLDMRGAIGNDPEGFAAMQKSGHDVNWGDTGEVFSAAQSYLKRVAAVAVSPLDLTYRDFGLAKTLKSNLKTPKKAFKYQDKIDSAGRVVLKDMDKMPRWSNELLLRTLPDNVRDSLPATLKTPDEVYWNESGSKMQYTYLKAYKDYIMHVVVEFSRSDNAQIVIVNKVGDANELRKGLLVN